MKIISFNPPPRQNISNVLLFDEGAYKRYLSSWLNGIKHEMYYWKNFIETKGREWKTNWEDLISNDRPFLLEQYLEVDAVKTKLLDVGSGPFSSCGLKTAKTQLEISAVDPLAYIYKAIKTRNKITTGITPEYAIAERLVEKFGENNFDIVHIRNALDHSFSPLMGIYQMLSVCKIGGKVILSHAANEAENENYKGFHQWNLCAENGEFIVWRPGDKFNVSDIFYDYASVMVDTTPVWVTVVLIKKNNLPRLNDIEKSLAVILDEKIFEKLSDLIVTDVYKHGVEKIVLLKRLLRKIPFLGDILKSVYRKITFARLPV